MLPVTSPVPGLKSSTSPSTGKNSRISPARSGWRAVYSSSDGRSPRRRRSRNSSARPRSTDDLMKRRTCSGSRCGHPAQGVAIIACGRTGRESARAHLKPLEGPDVPLAGRRDLQAQDLGHLGVGQLLEMPQGDDLPVERIHAVEGGLDLDLDLGPRERLARRGVMAQQLGRQRDRAGLRQRPLVQRDLATGIPHRRAQMLAMDPHQPLPGHQPQPEEERHLALGQVMRQLLGDVEIRLLEHVGGIDPPLEPAVEPQPHHLPQPFAVAAEQLGQRGLVALAGAVDQPLVVKPGAWTHSRSWIISLSRYFARGTIVDWKNSLLR